MPIHLLLDPMCFTLLSKSCERLAIKLYFLIAICNFAMGFHSHFHIFKNPMMCTLPYPNCIPSVLQTQYKIIIIWFVLCCIIPISFYVTCTTKHHKINHNIVLVRCKQFLLLHVDLFQCVQ